MAINPKLTLDNAFALKSPEDSIRFYGDWADTYDADFVASTGYVYHLRVVECLTQHLSDIQGPVLDIGCGTGIVGVALRNAGIKCVDGIDISAAMLARCRAKTSDSGEPAYRNLIEADLTKKLSLPSNCYAAMISSGAFTHGHLGPESLVELWRVAAPGAICVIGINSQHYDLMGFGEAIANDVASKVISSPSFTEVAIYDAHDIDFEHADDTALILECRVL